MKNEFQEFLNEFRDEVDAICNKYFDEYKTPPAMGMDAYVMHKLKQNAPDKAVSAYHEVWKAFAILSGDTIKNETRNDIYGDVIDQKKLILTTEFTRDQIQTIAEYVITNDHIGFTNFLAKILNMRVARGYSKAIFKRAPRK